jgi:hypothetical protein
MFGFIKWPLFSSSSNADEDQSTASSSSTSATYLVVKKCPIGVSDIDLFTHFKKLARHSLESVQCVQLQQHRDALLRFALSEGTCRAYLSVAVEFFLQSCRKFASCDLSGTLINLIYMCYIYCKWHRHKIRVFLFCCLFRC